MYRTREALYYSQSWPSMDSSERFSFRSTGGTLILKQRFLLLISGKQTVTEALREAVIIDDCPWNPSGHPPRDATAPHQLPTISAKIRSGEDIDACFGHQIAGTNYELTQLSSIIHDSTPRHAEIWLGTRGETPVHTVDHPCSRFRGSLLRLPRVTSCLE